MVKRTKTQKKRMLDSIHNKAVEMFLHGILTANDVNTIHKICKAGMRKL